MTPKTSPEPTVPTQDALMWPVLRAMKELDGSARNEELLQKVIEIEHIPEAVQNVPSTQRRTKLAHHVAFALTNLGRWGALENPSRGVWTLTEKGRAVTQEQVGRIPKELRAQRRMEPNAEDETELKPERDDWKDELLKVLMEMKPEAFEQLAGLMLRKQGFQNVKVTGKSGDGGIDGEGVLRLNGLVSFRVYFQCKRYGDKNPISSSEVQKFRGAMTGRTDRGLFITTSTFTANAQREAARDPLIDLVDGEQLCDLLKELKLGVVEKTDVDRSWFDKI